RLLRGELPGHRVHLPQLFHDVLRDARYLVLPVLALDPPAGGVGLLAGREYPSSHDVFRVIERDHVAAALALRPRPGTGVVAISPAIAAAAAIHRLAAAIAL